jgi:hypothetical protein
MTTAAQGLRLAKPRTETSASAVALADLNADGILAGISDTTRAALAASLAPAASSAPAPQAGAAPKKDGEEEEEMGEDGKPKKKAEVSASEPTSEALAQAEAKGFAAGTARAVGVMMHDDFGGRAKAAATLLGNAKLSSLSSDEIVDLMAGKPDEGAAAMAAALAADKNPELGGGGSDASTAKSDSAASWKRATAKVNDRFGPKL